jgi:phosphate transport system substrate-binding protein
VRAAALLLALAAAGAPPPEASYLTRDGAVRIVGYNDMAGLIARWDALYSARHPGVRFAPDLPATKAAPPALLSGRSALAPMGAEMTPEDLARIRDAWGAEPLAVRVAHDSLDPRALSGPLGIVVARGNPLKSLTLGQVAALFAADGTARTWGDLGLTGDWAARPVHLLGLNPDTALARFLQARAFPGRPYRPELQGFGHSTDVVAATAADPLAIGIAAVNVATPGVRVLRLAAEGERPVAPTRAALQAGAYPLDRSLLIYVRRPLDPFVRAYLELVLSPEGQAAVAQDPLGYIPLTPREARAEQARLAGDAPPGRSGRASPVGPDQPPK